jgi:hypothetical protein
MMQMTDSNSEDRRSTVWRIVTIGWCCGLEYLGHWIDLFSTSSYADTQGISAYQTLVNKSTLKKAALDCDQVSAIILLSSPTITHLRWVARIW